MDLSIIIPARNEEWLSRTIDDIFANARAETEVIAIFDGYWPEPGIQDRPNLRIVHHTEPVGQRAATNEGARLSNAKYVMKADAHCAFDEGFDAKLIADCQPDWTMVPRQYNLHVFNWRCNKCRAETYQGPQPTACSVPGCDGKEFSKAVVWKPRLNRRSDFWRFDKTLHFQYWRECGHRPENRSSEICDIMSCLGACWMMERKRYWDLDGMDEAHGSWGQMGTELACKSWLSGGRMVVSKKTWFAHLFRTQPGFGFPYPNPGTGARQYSQDLWINNKWPKQKYKLDWLIDKFKPVPDWHTEELCRQ